nr:O-antigen ligase family protein [Lachnospiraceae bacterium]
MAAKLAKKQKKKENTGKLVVTGFLEYMCVLWAIVMSFALALYMKDGYYQIGTAKYHAYEKVVVFGMPLLLILMILYVMFDWKENGVGIRRMKEMGRGLSVTDWFVLAYIVFALVSFLCSGHMEQAWKGYDGWFMGLFSQISFVAIYFVFSRFMKDYPVTLGALCLVTFYVYVVGIQHRLLIDPLGVYETLADHYKIQFLSTLGQASWYSSFMITILPVGMFTFWYAKNRVLRVLSGIFVFAGFMTLVTQNTDSAYFGFLAAMLVLFHVSVKEAGRMRRLFELMLMFVLAPKAMWLLLKIYPNDIMYWDKISSLLLYGNIMWLFVLLCVAGIVVMALLEKTGKYPVLAMRICRNAVYVILLCLLISWILILVADANGWFPDIIDSISRHIPYLKWNREWGNGRGFTWSFTVMMFGEMNLKNKLLGVGPDCYAIYAHGRYNELLQSKWGSSILTNAHNEWLNMFVDLGYFGGVSYLGVFLSALVRFVKNSENRPVLLGFAACIAAYMAHNMFCYQQVLCTPLIFLFMAMGEYQIRRKAE